MKTRQMSSGEQLRMPELYFLSAWHVIIINRRRVVEFNLVPETISSCFWCGNIGTILRTIYTLLKTKSGVENSLLTR